MRTFKHVAACAVAAASTIVMSPAVDAAAEPRMIVVDDDGLQCGDADFDNVSEAVARANAGDTVKVCPGVYREFVRVDRPLTLAGASRSHRRARVLRPRIVADG